MTKSLDIIDWHIYSPNPSQYPVIGVDEAGRGCLAGPVYAAAAILKHDSHNSILTDSKLLSEKRRKELSDLIKTEHIYGLGFATVEEIDQINILQASLLAMKRAVELICSQHKIMSAHVVVDGNFKIPGLKGFEQTTVVKGDLRVAPISAASIVAKVTRDELMKELGKEFPGYGFEKHKGYSTADHKKSIQAIGPCIQHRKSFSGVKEYI